ncbi:Shikimate 5-dehydrogenase [Granulibacter bethesdensis CGDNIH4]|nr:Shikimate 5-dehydrogenase [Granulibacter bethesdensis CGDNIH4]
MVSDGMTSSIVSAPLCSGLSGAARLAGVIGWPVQHSRSPKLHGHWLARYRIDGAYVPLAVPPERFETAVRGLVACGFRGANVTIPHKQAALALCDEVEDQALLAGAVNTLVFENGRIIGRNTDGDGFIANLRDHGIDPSAGPVLLLGAGGAARGIAAALSASVPVTLCARRDEAAAELAALLPNVSAVPWSRREDVLKEYALMVNTTAAGMEGHAALEIDLSRAPDGLAVADIVYTPLETPLLHAARLRGLPVAEGLGMLLHQARPGFRSWFGVEPEVDDALRTAVLAG